MIDKIYINDEILQNVLVLDVGNEKVSQKKYSVSVAFGSNNRVILDENSYQGYTRTIKLLIDDYNDIRSVIDKIKGINNKIRFNDGKFYFLYDMLDGLDIKRLTDFTHYILEIPLYIHPFKYYNEDDIYTVTGSTTIINKGNVYSEPLITVHGMGVCDIAIGSQKIKLKVTDVATIECMHGKQNIYDGSGNLSNSSLIKGSFFEIEPKNNSVVISSNVTKLVIKMRSREL